MKTPTKDDADSALGYASATAHRAVDSAKEAARPAANWVGDQVDDAATYGRKYAGDSSRYIAKNPLMAVVVAVVAGFFISKLIG